jgi:trans-L-3-hydroxyproline dehydratase
MLGLYEPPARFGRVTAIDMHTGGEPLRVIVEGLPPIEGSNVLEKRRYFRDHYDDLRKALMWEPRGHADMYGAVLTRSQDADFDAFFLHNEGYSTMCGHAIIALTKLVYEAGLIDVSTSPEVTFNVPAGMIRARPVVREGLVSSSCFRGVPSFVYLRERMVQVPGIGAVRLDIAYGGAFYAIVEAPEGLALDRSQYSRLIDYGRAIKHAAMRDLSVRHPFEDDLSFLYGTIIAGPPASPGHHSRNVCIFADGEVDRSATGSGVSARAALHYARGELGVGEAIAIESIIGSTMTVEVLESVKFGPYDAVVPQVGGTAHVTARHEFYFDPADPLNSGFILR